MFITVLMKFSGLLSKIIITRYISPFEYGILTFVTISLPLIFQFITNLSFFNLLSHSKKGKLYFKFSIIYVVISSSLVIIVFYIFLDYFLEIFNIPREYSWISFVTFALLLIPLSFTVILMGLFRGLRKYSVATITSSLQPFLRFIFIIALAIILPKLTFSSIILATIASAWVAFLAIVFYERQIIKTHLNLTQSRPPIDMFLFSISIFIVGSYGTLLQVLGRVVVAYDIDITYQGYFDISITLMTLLSIPTIALSFLTIPEATSANNKNELFEGEINDVAKFLFSILLFLVMIVSIYSREIIEFLFSPKYAPAADFVVFLAVGSIFMFIQQFIAYVEISFYETLSDYKPFVIFTIVCIILFPITTHMLITLIGFSGAYISNFLFKVVYFMGSIRVGSKKTTKIFTTKLHGLIVPFIVAIVFVVLIKGKFNFILEILIVAILFTLLLVKLNYFDLRKLFSF